MTQSSVMDQQQPATSSPLLRYPLVSFFVLAYALTWLAWLPLVLSTGGGLGLIPFTTPDNINTPNINVVLMMVGYFGPAIAAIVMSGMTGGWTGVQQLLRRMVQARAGLQWYLIAVFVPLAISVASALVLGSSVLLPLFGSFGSLAIFLYIFATVMDMVLGPALTTEPGWRGFALPRLQQQHGPLVGSLILGGLWAFWHLPLFFTVWGKGYASTGLLLGFLLFALTTLGYTFLLTWVFNNTRGSIFMAILLHSATDSVGAFFAVFATQKEVANLGTQIASTTGLIASALLWLIVAAFITIFTKGKLSYNPEEEIADSVEEEQTDTRK